MKVLLATPPISDLNTPYPATAVLMGMLTGIGYDVRQADFSIELALRLYAPDGLNRVRRRIETLGQAGNPICKSFVANFERHLSVIEPAVAILQGRDSGLEERLIRKGFMPPGRRIDRVYEDVYAIKRDAEAFGELGRTDRGRYIASQYLLDLSEVIGQIEPGFVLGSYARDVGSNPSFDKVLDFLEATGSGLVDELVGDIVRDVFAEQLPDVLGLTAPFAGNFVGALKVARAARELKPGIPVILGGGFPNTFLRTLSEPRLFDFIDFVTLDDGERPLACVLEHLNGQRPKQGLLRTYYRERGQVVYQSIPTEKDVPFVESATPCYRGLKLDRYLSVWHDITKANRIWSQRWNKLTLAHGCYWRKCTFCDLSLDYINRYEPQRVDRLLKHIRRIIDENGYCGFHFVDEAMPPSLLRKLSAKLIEDKVSIAWYGNIRFEKAFTPQLAQLMADAGCVMVTGGLEVASDRLLKLMKKGVTVAQVARVAKAFSDAGIFVHAYLMYGFPTETEEDTVNSLELVRQMFKAGCLRSGYWHRLKATAHSPIGQSPEQFGISLHDPRRSGEVFAQFDMPFDDPTNVDHDALGKGLERALRNYRRGVGINRPVTSWFPVEVPEPTVASDAIARAISDDAVSTPMDDSTSVQNDVAACSDATRDQVPSVLQRLAKTLADHFRQ